MNKAIVDRMPIASEIVYLAGTMMVKHHCLLRLI